ncbi:hypothetical protein H7H52_01145, partial [Mycolicibacter hiberniae]
QIAVVAAAVLIAALAAMAVAGCAADAHRARAAGGGALVPVAAAAAAGAPGLFRAPADPVGAQLDAPCPHAQLAPAAALGGDELSLRWALPMVSSAVPAADAVIGAPVRGPPGPPRGAAAAGPLSLHQLCVIRR